MPHLQTLLKARVNILHLKNCVQSDGLWRWDNTACTLLETPGRKVASLQGKPPDLVGCWSIEVLMSDLHTLPESSHVAATNS